MCEQITIKGKLVSLISGTIAKIELTLEELASQLTNEQWDKIKNIKWQHELKPKKIGGLMQIIGREELEITRNFLLEYLEHLRKKEPYAVNTISTIEETLKALPDAEAESNPANNLAG